MKKDILYIDRIQLNLKNFQIFHFWDGIVKQTFRATVPLRWLYT
jgi:hypothetical protein